MTRDSRQNCLQIRKRVLNLGLRTVSLFVFHTNGRKIFYDSKSSFSRRSTRNTTSIPSDIVANLETDLSCVRDHQL